MKNSKEEIDETLAQLYYILNESNLTQTQLLELTCNFLYTIGNSMEGNPSLQSSEKVLQRYAEHPTFGNALMTQSLFMKETWKVKDERESDDREQSDRVNGRREPEIDGPTSVQDLQGN